MDQKNQKIAILSLKPRNGRPYDSVETTMANVFGRLPSPPFSDEWVGSGPTLWDGRSGKYEILFGVGRPEEMLGVFGRPKKTKYALHYQSIMLKKSEPHWRVRMPWFLRKFIFSQADMVIAPSAFSAGTIKKFFPKTRVEFVLNGIDPNFFHPSKRNVPHLAEKFGVNISKPIVTFVGALQGRKRPDVFIEIARRLPDATFLAVGRPLPELEGDFLTRAQDIPNFQSIPLMSREDMAICLASSEIFVFPSLREPAALCILESMASGAVPVMSKSGGSVEFLKDGESGFLVPQDEKEIDAFVAIIKKLLSDEHLRRTFSAAARREAEGHTWDVAAKKYEGLFLSLVRE